MERLSKIFILLYISVCISCSNSMFDMAKDVDMNRHAWSWTHPLSLSDNISPDGQIAESPQVAMDNSGNAIITWHQNSGTYYQIFKSEYRNGVWTHPSSLNDNISPDTENAYNPQVAMDNSGNAIIVWFQYDGTRDQIFKSEYRNGAWIHPTGLSDNISPDGQNAVTPQVAMDNNGNAIIVWRESDGLDTQIFKSEYRNGTWLHPSGLSDNISPDGQDAVTPQVAMDNNGNAIITWAQYTPANQIFKSEYRNGTWIHPASLSDNMSPDGQNAQSQHVAMDDNGNAIIVWHQPDSAFSQIFKSEYRNGLWINPSSLSDNISPDSENAYYPTVNMDSNGNTIIAWHQSNGANEQILKSEYSNDVWINPSGLSDNISPDGQDANLPQIDMDSSGNAIIVWYQYNGINNQIFMSEYRKGSWVNPSAISDNISPDGQDAINPKVAMDANGNAIVVWQQNDGTNTQIFKSEYR